MVVDHPGVADTRCGASHDAAHVDAVIEGDGHLGRGELTSPRRTDVGHHQSLVAGPVDGLEGARHSSAQGRALGVFDARAEVELVTVSPIEG